MSGLGGFVQWARRRSSPKDLLPIAVGIWLLKSGVEKGNEMFVFIALYLFGFVPAWWADKEPPPIPGVPKPIELPPPEAPKPATAEGEE